MNESLLEVLMRRDVLTEDEAQQVIDEARAELNELLEEGEDINEADFCMNWFGLEPDYIIELL